jgi:hypothetical protein
MTAVNLEPDRLVVQAEGCIVSDMGNEKVMMSIRKGKYYNLGEVGGRIWELIASPMTVSQLADRLTAEYDVERNTCERQVADFLACLHREELIRVLPGPADGPGEGT